MGLKTLTRWMPLGGVLLHLSSATSHALLKLNEGRDQFFVSASTSFVYDTNIFSQSDAESDFLNNSSATLEYARRAGLISVNAQASWELGKFASNTSEDFSNPTLNVEFSKTSGRTTGTLTLSAARKSQADPVANQRTDSWNYNAALNWKYPVIERYSFSGTFGYGNVDYVDNSASLVDLSTYTASTDLFYAYTSQRDLFGGYRIRLSDTSSGGQTIDHAITGGLSGKILAKLNGSARVGYQIREDGDTGEQYGSVTSAISATWNVSKRSSLTLTINKDFSTTATDSTADTLGVQLDGQYALTHQWSLFSGLGWGQSDFLNGVDSGRRDEYFTWSLGANYSFNEHFKASLTYAYFQNWSNRSTSSFERNTVTLNLTTRW